MCTHWRFIAVRVMTILLTINEIWMLWGENRGKWKRLAAAGSWTQDTSGLSRQCSTIARQPDNHQPLQSSICTAHNIQISFISSLRQDALSNFTNILLVHMELDAVVLCVGLGYPHSQVVVTRGLSYMIEQLKCMEMLLRNSCILYSTV